MLVRLQNNQLENFEKYISLPVGRKMFRAQLNMYRISHKKVMSKQSFVTLKSLIWKILDKMDHIEGRSMYESFKQTQDYEESRKPSFVSDDQRERIETCMDCMIMSDTFCYQIDQTNKVFLHSSIKYHPMWQNNDYWVEVIIHSIREEINKNSINPEDIQDILNPDDVMSIVETKLNWFIHNMVSFHIGFNNIQSIVRTIAMMYCLPESRYKVNLLF